MLLLRDDQIAALADDLMRRQVRLHLRRNHRAAVQDLPFDTLTGRVAFGVARARAAGLTWVSSIAGFVALMFTIAPDFDRHALVSRLLDGADPETAGLPPDERLLALGHLLAAEAWELVRADGGAWPETVA